MRGLLPNLTQLSGLMGKHVELVVGQFHDLPSGPRGAHGEDERVHLAVFPRHHAVDDDHVEGEAFFVRAETSVVGVETTVARAAETIVVKADTTVGRVDTAGISRVEITTLVRNGEGDGRVSIRTRGGVVQGAEARDRGDSR